MFRSTKMSGTHYIVEFEWGDEDEMDNLRELLEGGDLVILHQDLDILKEFCDDGDPVVLVEPE